VFVVIHDNGEADTRSYAHINCITKWPVWFAASSGSFGLDLDFDPFNYANDVNFRNVIATEQDILTHMDPVDSSQMQSMESKYKNYMDWYHARNKANPHEVNTDYYIQRDGFPEHSVFQLSCLDIASKSLTEKLDKIMTLSQCSTRFNTQQITDAHKDYIQNQKNLQWFDSVAEWKQSGKLDEYLLSHSGIQGQILSRILQDCEFLKETSELEQLRWQAWYYRLKGSDWPDCDSEQDFINLPAHIQHELITMFKYQPRFSLDLARARCRSELTDWKNLELDQINDIYQTHKTNFSLPRVV